MCNSNEITKVYLGTTEVYSSSLPTLRNIVVGDNLSSKVLYFEFPDNMYTEFGSTQGYAIQSGSNYIGMFISGQFGENKYVFISPPNTSVYYNSSGTTTTNLATITLPSNFGTVTTIDTTKPIYQYIKIYN